MVERLPCRQKARKAVPHSHHRRHKSFALIALNLAIVLIVGGGTAAYAALSKTVTVAVDGRTQTVRTFGDRVSDVLAAKNITIRDGDKLSASPSSRLHDGDRVEVSYAKPVTLAVDGKVSDHTVYGATVGDVLDEFGVTTPADAYVSSSRTASLPRNGSEIVVSNAKSLTVIADGKHSTLTTNAPTVAAVLRVANVTLGKDDEIQPGTSAFVAPDQKVRVVRIKKVAKTETVGIKYPVKVRKDASALVGETSVLTAGKNGKSRQNVVLVYADGKVRDRIVLVSRTLTQPRPQIETVGTQTTSPDSVWDKIARCESGGNWSINTGNGYYGGLQFSAATWHSVGGTGLPNQHTREEQIKRAKILQARSGWGQWGCAGARFN